MMIHWETFQDSNELSLCCSGLTMNVESVATSRTAMEIGIASQTDRKPVLQPALICPLCGSGRSEWELDAEMFGAGPYEHELFSIYRCRACEIGITDPVPSEANSRLLYEDRTSLDFQAGDSSITTHFKNLAADQDVRKLITGAQLRQPPRSVLDYACGNGAFAMSLRRAVAGAAVWATDYHSEAPPMLSGRDIRYCSYADLPGHAPFDLVLCRHVLEHTYDPSDFLGRIRDLMSPGGVLLLEVPNLKAPLRRLFGKHWDGYYVPYHPVHFSAAALRHAAVKAGLIPEKAAGTEMPKIGRSLRNWIGCPYNAALFATGVLLHPLQFGAKFVTGEPTCLRLWARKP